MTFELPDCPAVRSYVARYGVYTYVSTISYAYKSPTSTIACLGLAHRT